MGAGGCHAIGTSIFVQFCIALRRYQCSILFNFVSTKDSAIEGGGECHTPSFDPVALDVYDVYIYCNNHGAELKAKAPPLIGYAMFPVEIVTDGISGHCNVPGFDPVCMMYIL